MNELKFGQRVTVNATYQNPEMHGKTGTVVRSRIGDEGAWVNMDCDLPVAEQSFAANDQRFRHILLYPEECDLLEREAGE